MGGTGRNASLMARAARIETMALPGESRCPRCGGGVGAARFCPGCGAPLALLTPGEILDERYEILDKIGEGGMGEVYRARHIHLDEIRIIKVTKPDAAGGVQEPRRFQEEARMATLVRHPNVAALYDFSRRADGSFYMAWEFIDGLTLQQWLRLHGALPLDQTLDVAQQVLAGLEAIHGQGIVHRDISPDNIMVREVSGGRLQAKIIDLGIAKRVAAESLEMTGTGMFLGKLKYGSPEQAGSLGPGQAIDRRSDLYSFGVVLYEMLAGNAPFEAKTPQEYLGKHLHQPPPPLDLSALPKTVRPAIAAAVAKALEKNRERRFRDPREFAEALRAISSPTLEPQPAGTSNETDETAELRTGTVRRSARPVVVTALAVAAVAGLWALAHRPAPDAESAILTGRATPHSGPTVQAPTLPPTEQPLSPTIAVPAAIPTGPEAEATPVRPRTAAPRTAAASPTAPATATGTPTPPSKPDADRRRQRLERWMGRPIEERAKRAGEIAQWANKAASEHPGAPDVRQMKIDLPALFKGETLGALDQKRPYLAMMFYRAYLSLDFAPADAELARRVNAAAPLLRRTPG
jgi:serine/threonine protein kinase